MSMVLIPGFMLDNTLWGAFEHQLPAEWPTYYAPLTGGTTVPEIARHNIAHLPERFVVVGFSLGAYVARQIAADYPERVMALVIIASSPREDSPEMVKGKQFLVNAYTSDSFKGLSSGAIIASLHPRHEQNMALVTQIKEMGSRLGYEALVTQCGLSRAGVPASSIQCPTLVVAAENDALHLLEESRELAATIPNATLQIIGESGHMLPLEKPQELAGVIMRWLQEQVAMRY